MCSSGCPSRNARGDHEPFEIGHRPGQVRGERPAQAPAKDVRQCPVIPDLIALWCAESVPKVFAEVEIAVSSTPPEFVSDTVCAAESWPSAVDEKDSDVGFRTSAGAATPVPLSSTVCVPAPSTNVSSPDAGPACVGANSTCNWQSELAGRLVVPQALLKRTNGGVMETLVIGIAAAPLFPAVTESDGDVVPTSTWPNGTEALAVWQPRRRPGARCVMSCDGG